MQPIIWVPFSVHGHVGREIAIPGATLNYTTSVERGAKKDNRRSFWMTHLISDILLNEFD